MAGAMRKMAVYLGLVEDEDRYEEYDDYEDYAEAPVESGRDERTREARAEAQQTRVMPAAREAREGRGTVTTMPSAERRPAPGHTGMDAYRITTIHPRTYNEAKQIGEAFREGTPVIMNLTDMDDADAKRLVDFSAGLVFGLRGSIERVTNKVFLLSPANVEVTAEDKRRMVESGFFNQS